VASPASRRRAKVEKGRPRRRAAIGIEQPFLHELELVDLDVRHRACIERCEATSQEGDAST